VRYLWSLLAWLVTIYAVDTALGRPASVALVLVVFAVWLGVVAAREPDRRPRGKVYVRGR
jgi:hypothetical protein